MIEIQQRVPRLALKKRESDEDKLSVLDFGAGLGSGMWAAVHCYGKHQLLRGAAVEPNGNMRKLGKFLMKELDEEDQVLWVDSLAMIPGSGGERGKFDIVILGYVL